MVARTTRQALVLTAALGASGCGMTLSPATLGGAPSGPLPATLTTHDASPVEVYSRVARGALNCWFGVQGSLKKTHVFHANVASPVSGGGADIDVFERDPAAENPRSLRAFKVLIAPFGTGASVTAENLRFPADMGRDLSADVARWAAGGEGCSVIGTGGWAAQTGLATSAIEPEPAKAAKKKTKAQK